MDPLSRVCFVKCDVTCAKDWEHLWGKAEELLGGTIDILCNNAGVPWQISCYQLANTALFTVTEVS